MQKTVATNQAAAPAPPDYTAIPVIANTLNERKLRDPSSTPRAQQYPIPAFFEYRIKPRDFDPL